MSCFIERNWIKCNIVLIILKRKNIIDIYINIDGKYGGSLKNFFTPNSCRESRIQNIDELQGG